MEEEDEERKELERLLAAELASLILDEENGDENDAHQYVRLDLECVLRETESTGTFAHGDNDTWKMLLESVAVSDTHVFQVFADEMQQLRAEIMPAMTAMTDNDTVLEERKGGAVGSDDTQPPVMIQVEAESHSTGVEGGGDSKDGSDMVAAGVLHVFIEELDTRDEVVHEDHIVKAEPLPSDIPLDERASLVSTSPQVEVADDKTQQQLAEVESVAAQREALRLKAQEQAKAAQAEMEAWLQEQQRRMETELEEKHRRQEEARRQRQACEQMQREEQRTQRVEKERQLTQERRLMREEDEATRRIECWRLKVTDMEAKERGLMALEESRVWRVIKTEQDRERKEKLVGERSRLKRWHCRVMEELVLRVDARRRAVDAEKRRAMREAADMRSEEHWMRRVILQERAVREENERQRNRCSMEKEDQLAQKIREEAARVVREREEWVKMCCEEERSRIWETLWRLRTKRLRLWCNGEGKRSMRMSWVRWSAVVKEYKRQDEEAEQLRLREEAEGRIQQWIWKHAAQRQRMRKAEHIEAARVVQSAFRGFHVRRRFQNALEMARNMREDGVDDGDFEEVNLEELIQEPPELDDDWERPDITVICVRPQLVQTNCASEEEMSDDREDSRVEGDEDELIGDVVAYPTSQRQQHVPADLSYAHRNGEGGNLAAVLWNKMRKKTQKRQQALEERQRQKDPAYRVKKLLSKSTNPQGHASSIQPVGTSSHTSAPATITWSTPSDKKKAPKVKLPSLVERLRKKTAASR